MDTPAQPIQPTQPAPPTNDAVEKIAKQRKVRTIWGICLIAGPTALILAFSILRALFNLILSSSMADCTPGIAEACSAAPSMTLGIINIAFFIVIGVAVLSWLPALIVGIVLLSTKPALPQKQ